MSDDKETTPSASSHADIDKAREESLLIVDRAMDKLIVLLAKEAARRDHEVLLKESRENRLITATSEDDPSLPLNR